MSLVTFIAITYITMHLYLMETIMILSLLNPVKLIKAFLYHRSKSSQGKSRNNMELHFYSKMLKNEMLHLGYFNDPDTQPESISIEQVEEAQIIYAEKIIKQIEKTNAPVLDVGCGMGGLSGRIQKKGHLVEALTPDSNQIKYINEKYKNLTTHQCRFGKFSSDRKYGTVINSESLQYISLDKAFEKVEQILHTDGRWIITDFFRTNDTGINKSGHLLEDFLSKIKNGGWEIVYEEDITLNILPTLKLINLYASRFLLPAMDLASEKLHQKKSWLFYLTQELRDTLSDKIDLELAAIDPQKFVAEKKYLFYVFKKRTN